MPDSPVPIAALRHMVSAIETASPARRHCDGAMDGWMRHGLARAQVHEIHAADGGDGPAAIGFAIALALAGGALPALWIRTERDERRAGRLHASGLVELGWPAHALVLAVVPDEAALLRVAADAARCPALGLVLIETHGPAAGLDLTATRRLMLAAEGSGTTVLSVRIGGPVVPTAAMTRWGVAASPSVALAANAPGPPVFDVECLRRRGGAAGVRTRVEWNRDTRCFVPTAGDARRQAPLAGAGLSLAAGRAAARHPSPPLRGTG